METDKTLNKIPEIFAGRERQILRSAEESTAKASVAQRISAGAAIAAAAGLTLFVARFNPTSVTIFPPCPFRLLTGLNCPGCGLTRGFHALFHGDVLTALHFNALLPVYAFVLGFLFLSLALIAVRGGGLSFKLLPPRFLYFFLIASLIFAVIRNLPFYPFNLLSI